MPIPFLKVKRETGLMTEVRKPDAKPEGESDDSGLTMAAADLIAAVHSGDEKGVAAALKAAFDILDSMPHEEGPHMDESQEEIE